MNALNILQGLIPDRDERYQWVTEAVLAYVDAEKDWGVQEARGVVGFAADSFLGMEPHDRLLLINFIQDLAEGLGRSVQYISASDHPILASLLQDR